MKPGLDVILRLILWRHFEGKVLLEKVLPGERACILEHDDGTRGVVPVQSVFQLEIA